MCSLGRVRLLETSDLNLTESYSLEFTIRVGSFRPGCPRPTDSTENIFLQYSTNGGVTWDLIQTIPFYIGTYPSQQNVLLLNAAKTSSTRIRWYQPKASGSNLDVWALDDVYIESVAISLPVVDTFDPIRYVSVDGVMCSHPKDSIRSAGTFCGGLIQVPR